MPPRRHCCACSADALTTTATTRIVRLEDGSRVHLAPDSAIGPAKRRVHLLRGEAWFDVHRDRARPFEVEAGRDRRAARREGTVTLHVTMDRTGRVLAMRIARGSGSFELDRAAIDTLERAQPLPAIPPDMPERVELTLPVAFRLR
ncbi:TonB family protein [Novosphingobium sp. 1949]|uniref:TonB family protein n=1 Tax=Novosphingobium organovorum TaxID=2930092 RepID=A0ABT0BBY4_9SPHN|nr:TonB family protein [Novosphingobium organovorum]MCJ2182560.1 TonB family protein [Novosphingobium organovorum]